MFYLIVYINLLGCISSKLIGAKVSGLWTAYREIDPYEASAHIDFTNIFKKINFRPKLHLFYLFDLYPPYLSCFKAFYADLKNFSISS